MRKLFRKTKKCIRWIYCFVEAFVALVIILAGIAFWRLYTEPMDAEFLLPEVAAQFFPEDSKYTMEMESSQLFAVPNSQGLIHLNVKNLKVIRPDKTVALSLPEVNLSYGLWHILTLNYTPDTLEIIKPYLRLIIDEQGGVSFQAGDDSTNNVVAHETELPELRKVMHQILSFSSLHITNGQIQIDDLLLKEKLSVPKFSFVLGRGFGFRHVARFSSTIRLQDELVDLQARGEYRRWTKNLNLEIGIPKINLARLKRFAPALEGIGFPVSISTTSTFNLRKSSTNLADCLTKLKFQVKALSPGKLNTPSPIKNTYSVESLEINGMASDGFKTVKIAKSLAVLQGGITAQLGVDVNGADKFFHSWNPKDLMTILDAVVENVPMADVPKVWPSERGPDAHAWVKKHLSQGKIATSKFRLFFEGPELVDLFGDVRAQGVTVDYLPPMKPVRDVFAQVLLYPDMVHIITSSGYIQDLQLKSGDLKFYDVQTDHSWTEMNLGVSGPVKQALRLIESKPLELTQQFNIPVDKLSGSGNVGVYLKFPLDENLKPKDIEVKVAAQAKNVELNVDYPGIVVKNGVFDLDVTNKGLQLSGTVKVSDQPVEVVWKENFEPFNEIVSEYELRGENVQVLAFKETVPDIEKYLSGPVDVDAKITKNNKEVWMGSATANLTKARVVLYPVSLSKKNNKNCLLAVNLDELTGTGTSGKVRFDMQGDIQKENDLSVVGSFQWNNGWKLEFDKVIAADNNFSGYIQDNAKSFGLKLKGSKWDISDLLEMPILKQTTVQSQTVPDVVQDILLDVDLGDFVVNKAYPVKQLKLNGKRNKKLWEKFNLQAQASKPFHITYFPAEKKFQGHFEDFGALLLHLAGTDRFKEGVMSFEAIQDDEGLIKGKLTVDKITWREPGFLLQAATILGIVDAFRGKDIEMDEVSIPFTLDPWHQVKLKDAYAAGSSVGVTVKGTINLQSLDLSGSVIPAYAVNSLPGKIPLLGALFRSEEGGGLIGVKYSVDGIPMNPQVHFHPLSSVLPGALGRVF